MFQNYTGNNGTDGVCSFQFGYVYIQTEICLCILYNTLYNINYVFVSAQYEIVVLIFNV